MMQKSEKVGVGFSDDDSDTVSTVERLYKDSMFNNMLSRSSQLVSS
jgi:hypothetical protein